MRKAQREKQKAEKRIQELYNELKNVPPPEQQFESKGR